MKKGNPIGQQQLQVYPNFIQILASKFSWTSFYNLESFSHPIIDLLSRPVISGEGRGGYTAFALSTEKPCSTGWPVKHGRVFLCLCHLSSVHVYSSLHWTSHFLQVTRNIRPCLTGNPVYYLGPSAVQSPQHSLI